MVKKILIISLLLIISKEIVLSQNQNRLDSIDASKKDIKFGTEYFDDTSNGKIVSNKTHIFTIEHKEKLDTFKIDTLLYENGVIHSISNHRYIKGKLRYDGLYRAYYPNGQKRLIIEMRINEIVAQKSYGYDGKDTAEVEYFIAPKFLDKDDKLQVFISENLVYPKEAYVNEIQGVIIVRFSILKDGSVSNVHVKKSVNKYLDEAAMKVIKLTNGKWKPAIQFGEIISTKATIPITFSLE